MHAFPCAPAEPKRADDEERARDAREGQAAHFFNFRPGALLPLRAREDSVPGEVHYRRDEGAYTNRQEREACFAAVEGVDAGEDDGIGLQVDVEYGVLTRC